MRLRVFLGAVAATAALAPAASAAQHHTSPTGSGMACSAAEPCHITQAFFRAAPGDHVVIEPGDYTLLASPPVANQITIRGVAGRPRPRLRFEGNQSGLMVPHGTVVRYVEIEQAEASMQALFSNGGTLDQVVIKGTAGPACAALIGGSTVRNSLVVGPGSGGSVVCAIQAGAGGTSTFRNVTAVATDSGGVAIEAIASGASQTVAADLVNVIAEGGPGGAGLAMTTDSAGAGASITARNTNFANYWTAGTNTHYVNGGGNQGVPPKFVDPAAGDFRQAAGSVTLGAGADEPGNGDFDVDGDPRTVGKTDIGADELVVAPTATTAAAGAISDHAATLNGSVNASGAPTTYRFEYGTTTAYGRSTGAASAGKGSGAVAAAATLDGLAPGTTYHFRLVASNAGGEVRGGDRTFTTAPRAQSPATPPATTPRPAFAGVELVSRRLRFARGFVSEQLACPAATPGRCTGRTKLAVHRGGKLVAIGRARFAIAPGSQAKVRVRVSRSGRALLRGARRLRGRVAIVARSDAGELKKTVSAVTLRRR